MDEYARRAVGITAIFVVLLGLVHTRASQACTFGTGDPAVQCH